MSSCLSPRRSQSAQHTGDVPFVTWGYSKWFHGPMSRQMLDERIGSDKPIIIWERLFHQVYVNSAGMDWLGIRSAADLPNLPGITEQVDLDGGHFFEAGLDAAFPSIQATFPVFRCR